MPDSAVRRRLQEGLVIPASPLALTPERKLDDRRQRALFRYYLAAGAGGLAVGVHTTQFEIRDPKSALYRPLLELAVEELSRAESQGPPLVRVAGICGLTDQAAAEASLARELCYTAGLINLSRLKEASDDGLVDHCRVVSETIPLFGFYLNPSLGGRPLSYRFWRRFAEIENLVAVKVAPFDLTVRTMVGKKTRRPAEGSISPCGPGRNPIPPALEQLPFDRYKTLDVIRAIAESGREEVALYTGNDDNIVLDLVTPYRFAVNGGTRERRIVGGLLGHWAVWTRRAVELLERCHAVGDAMPPMSLLRLAVEVTDCNAAFFDAANGFAGGRAGLHEVLRRQRLLEGIRLLDPSEGLSPGQREEIDRVCLAYPHLNDDTFVAEHLDEWLGG